MYILIPCWHSSRHALQWCNNSTHEVKLGPNIRYCISQVDTLYLQSLTKSEIYRASNEPDFYKENLQLFMLVFLSRLRCSYNTSIFY